MSSEKDHVNQLDFTVESFFEIIEGMKKNTKCKEIIKQEETLENDETINKITDIALYDLIIELILADSNVFLFGYGSKLKLVYNFINYFQDAVNKEYDENFHILVFNCFNPEVNLKYILSNIQEYVIKQLDSIGIESKEFQEMMKKNRTAEQIATYIQYMIENIFSQREIQMKFLVILNNIDGPNFQSVASQNLLSLLADTTNIRLIATSDNLYINYFWNQAVKDNFSFYFLKFHTFTPYEVEINEKNSLIGEKNIKTGTGLIAIYKSLTKNARDVLRVIAELQLREDQAILTQRGIVDYMTDEGLGICNSINRFMELIHEPMDHQILVKRNFKEKEIYKLNLEEKMVIKIANGEIDEGVDNY